jgi:hypothetical protein
MMDLARIKPLFFFMLLGCCASFFACQPKTQFEQLSSFRTGIKFVNELEEDETFNMVSFSNFYTGGGVGIGDINNDGLVDVFLGGNQSPSRLYLNKGNFNFEDITVKAGLVYSCWATGISMVDINADGWLDIYVSTSGHPQAENRNLLYINQGDNTFTEEAIPYGLGVTAQVTHSSFFDYDNDGDLDVFMAVNPTDFQLHMMGRISSRKLKGQAQSTDKLFRNNGDNTFTDVSKEAGILIEGYSLGVHTEDVNDDGCIDIFVGNDYVTNDILYINNCDGTFTDQLDSAFQHTSFASMGTDMGDFNNDGLIDIITVDMYPEDSYREKQLVAGGTNSYHMLKRKGYVAQHTRNVLYLNNGDGTYNEIGRLADIHRTDWSWAPLFLDLDNDGLKDIYITNGFAKEVGNLDFITYNENSPFANPNSSKAEQLKAIADQDGKPLVNYAFKNKGGFNFEKVSQDWGLGEPSISSGAAYADLDNDGDLDLIVNNINSKTFVYRNNSETFDGHHYISFKLEGSIKNPFAVGSRVTIYHDGQQQVATLNPYRGYISSVDQRVYFGLGNTTSIDSVKVKWPDGKVTRQYALEADQEVQLSYDSAESERAKSKGKLLLFAERSQQYKLIHKDEATSKKDFYSQPLVPRVNTHLGPALAVGDVNADGLEDLFVSGPIGKASQFFLQNIDGSFAKATFPHDPKLHDVGALLFDSDGDEDLDLYIVSGSNNNRLQMKQDSLLMQDRLYLNDGNGQWTPALDRLPEIRSSGSCVVASDYDKDGDLDLFVGGRTIPGQYPLTPRSYLLQNNQGNFKDITPEMDALANIGMVSSALWTDYNNDDWPDLILVGEWMQIEVFKNENGNLVRQTEAANLSNSHGWWNSIVGADFDMDGDIDYILGNQGLNTHYRANEAEPFCIYAKDFDDNGAIDPVMCQYIHGENYPVALRGELIQQLPILRKRFPNYETYASSTFSEVFSEEELSGAQIFKAHNLQSSYMENKGDGTFALKPLPKFAQSAPINGMEVTDINRDGWLDVLIVGNDYSNEVFHGYQDGMDGICLLNKGDGDFEAMHSKDSGFKVPGDAKALVSLSVGGQRLFVASQNNDRILSFSLVDNPEGVETIQAKPSQNTITINLQDGRSYRQEFYYGSGYLSQSSRAVDVFFPLKALQ